MLNPLLVLVWFAPGSFASLSCNPYLGSRGCVRRLCVRHLRLRKQGVHNTSNVDDNNSSRTTLRYYYRSIGIDASDGYDYNSSITEDMNISTVINSNVDNDIIDISDVNKTTNISITVKSSNVISKRNINTTSTRLKTGVLFLQATLTIRIQIPSWDTIRIGLNTMKYKQFYCL